MARFLPPSVGRYRVALHLPNNMVHMVDRTTLIEFLPRLEDHPDLRRGLLDFRLVLNQCGSLHSGRVGPHDMRHACGKIAEALEEGGHGLEGVTIELARKLDQLLEHDSEAGYGGALRHGSSFHRTRKIIICIAEISKILDSFPLASILHSFFQKNGAKIMNYEDPIRVGEWVMAIQFSRMNDNQLVLSYRELLKAKPELPFLLRDRFRPKEAREREAIENIMALAERMDDTGDHVGIYGRGRGRLRLDGDPIPGMIRALPRPPPYRINSYGEEHRLRLPRPGLTRYGSNGETAIRVHRLEREVANLRENLEERLAEVNERVEEAVEDTAMPRLQYGPGPLGAGYGDYDDYPFDDPEEYDIIQRWGVPAM